MLSSAIEHGFTNDRFDELKDTIHRHRNVFRTSFSAGPPAAVAPLRIKLQKDAIPTVVKLRRYSPEQRQFLKKLMDQLIKLDLVYPNPTSKWGSALHLVPKHGPDGWRFTSDLRPINRWTIAERFPMPNIEHELQKAKGSEFYGDFDLTHGYWQF